MAKKVSTKNNKKLLQLSGAFENNSKNRDAILVEKLQHQRKNIAIGTMVTFLVFLGLFSCQGMINTGSKKIGLMEYLSSEKSLPAKDPLLLANKIPGLRLLGTFEDTSTYGYESDAPPRQTAEHIATALQADGWVLDKTGSTALFGMYKALPSSEGTTIDQEKAHLQPDQHSNYLLVQCISAGGGTSVVVRIW